MRVTTGVRCKHRCIRETVVDLNEDQKKLQLQQTMIASQLFGHIQKYFPKGTPVVLMIGTFGENTPGIQLSNIMNPMASQRFVKLTSSYVDETIQKVRAGDKPPHNPEDN